MKRNSRTALLLTATLAAPLLASSIASRGQEADSIRSIIRPSALSAADSGDSGNRPPHLPSTSTVATPVHFEVFKVQSRKSITELESRLGKDAFAAMLKM